ncbi:MAG: epimerase, partial [Deltaproteobacteria bacterium]
SEGLDAVCVLPVTMFGPGDLNFNAGTYVRLVARGAGLFVPPGGTTVAHVDDVAHGHVLAWKKGAKGRRYILGGQPMTYREIFATIAGELGRRPPIATIPKALLHGAGTAADFTGKVLGRRLPFSRGLARAACSRLFYSSARAESELGYRFRPAAEAIADAVEWYRTNGLI